MAIFIVNLLKVVNIYKKAANGFVCAGASGYLLNQTLIKKPPVVYAGEWVGKSYSF